jgi:hypothetical protein
MNKRKNINAEQNSPNKKIKKDNFISASSLKNYINKDPIIDYLSYWHINDIDQNPDRQRQKIENNSNFLNYLFENGIKFEKNIFEKIKETHNITQVLNDMNDLNLEKFELTKKLLLDGVNIIYQGVLYNFKNKTYGIADLLVRSDYINKLVPGTINKLDELINNKFYYFAIDIKNSTIELNKDGKYVLNSGNLPFYKTQLLLYTQALSNILNINITKSFILGKRYHWSYNCYENNPFGKLGEIDYKNIDNIYYEKFNESLKWITNLRSNGHKWKLLPTPSIPELYPNMKNNNDFNWRPLKNKLANEINEITQIWNVGVKQRILAHKQKIYSWKNKKCNSNILGFNNKSSTGSIIDKIININRTCNNININSQTININPQTININPQTITYNSNNWMTCPNDTLEFYIDYETIIHDNQTYIFMIGVGYNDNGWKFKNFFLNNLSDDEFKIMINNFWIFIKLTLDNKNKNNSRFIHWTKAEPSQYNKCIEKFMLPNKNFIDLFEVFKKEPIVIKGAFSFSLKDIANAMYKNNMIKTCWSNIETNNCNNNETIKCNNGQDALLLGILLYKDNNILKEDNNILKIIRDYNEVDCKVLFEIIQYLRFNHI